MPAVQRLSILAMELIGGPLVDRVCLRSSSFVRSLETDGDSTAPAGDFLVKNDGSNGVRLVHEESLQRRPGRDPWRRQGAAGIRQNNVLPCKRAKSAVRKIMYELS